MISRMDLDSDAEIWQLPIIGFEVLEVWFSGELYLTAYGDRAGKREDAAPITRIRLGGPFTYQAEDGTDHRIVGDGPWSEAIPLLDLRRAKITEATADRHGNLALRFSNGSAIFAAPDPQYENWGLSGPGRLSLYAPPGGGDPRAVV